MKKIVISGGLGYVGGRLADYFSKSSKFEVYALSRNKNEEQFPFKVLTNEEVLAKGKLNDENIDVFIHLAATNEIVCSNQPQFSNEVNINGTLKWLEWAKKNKVGRFIYFSTVHVYDRPLQGTYDENSSCHPAHPYSISHKAAEDYVRWYARDFDLDCKIVRLSNSFGYPAFATADRWTLFVNDICKQIIAEGKIEIKSNRYQDRDFISLSNVCSALEILIYSEADTYHSIEYNLSNGKSRTLMEIASKVQEVANSYLNKSIELIFHEKKDVSVEKSCIANDKLKKLGWKPKSAEEENEIKQTLEFFIKN